MALTSKAMTVKQIIEALSLCEDQNLYVRMHGEGNVFTVELVSERVTRDLKYQQTLTPKLHVLLTGE